VTGFKKGKERGKKLNKMIYSRRRRCLKRIIEKFGIIGKKDGKIDIQMEMEGPTTKQHKKFFSNFLLLEREKRCYTLLNLLVKTGEMGVVFLGKGRKEKYNFFNYHFVRGKNTLCMELERGQGSVCRGEGVKASNVVYHQGLKIGDYHMHDKEERQYMI